MKHDIGEPEDKAYRIIPDCNAIIHDLPRMNRKTMGKKSS